MNKELRVVELFAGVGGFRLALDQANQAFGEDIFRTVWANQWEPDKRTQHAATIYRTHWDDGSLVNDDINKAQDLVPDFDLLVGGFPCQDFSIASTNAKGMAGKKGVLWWNINHIVQAHNPSFILLENVDRLLLSPSKQKGRDFGVMLRCLHKAGYHVEWRVINAAEWGFQQKRRRTFIFATNMNVTTLANEANIAGLQNGFFNSVFPVNYLGDGEQTNVGEQAYNILADVSDKFEFRFQNSGLMDKTGSVFTIKTTPSEPHPAIPLKKLLQSVKDISSPLYLTDYQDQRFQTMRNGKKVLRTRSDGSTWWYSEGRMAYPDPVDKPARTMLTSETAVNRMTHVVIDPKTKKKRVLTPTEAERIQGFPDGWTNVDGIPRKFPYFAMGNALVVPVVEKLAIRIAELSKTTL